MFKSYVDPPMLNTYICKDIKNRFPTYQDYQFIKYNARYPTLTTIAKSSITNLNPSNLPVNITDRNIYNVNYYHEGDYNFKNEVNSNTWCDNRAKPKYIKNMRPQSDVKLGLLSSHTNVHGFLVT